MRSQRSTYSLRKRDLPISYLANSEREILTSGKRFERDEEPVRGANKNSHAGKMPTYGQILDRPKFGLSGGRAHQALITGHTTQEAKMMRKLKTAPNHQRLIRCIE
jgi:hypothetical protein